MVRLALCLALALLLTGCAQTKFAAKDFVDDALGIEVNQQREIVDTTKQVALAPGRHGSTGLYLSGGAGGEPEIEGGGLELGLDYNAYWWSGQLGLAAYGSTPAECIFIGPTARLRVQLPTRLAPFAGVGAFAGYWEQERSLDHDHIDNDNDGWIDDSDESETDSFYFASVFPELGAHFWVTDWLRLSASGSYHITTEGRNHDFWMAGFTVAVFPYAR